MYTSKDVCGNNSIGACKEILQYLSDQHHPVYEIVQNINRDKQLVVRALKHFLTNGAACIFNAINGKPSETVYSKAIPLRAMYNIALTPKGQEMLTCLNTTNESNLPARDRGLRMKYGAYLISPTSANTKEAVLSLLRTCDGPTTIERLKPTFGGTEALALRYACYALHEGLLCVTNATGSDVAPFDEDTRLSLLLHVMPTEKGIALLESGGAQYERAPVFMPEGGKAGTYTFSTERATSMIHFILKQLSQAPQQVSFLVNDTHLSFVSLGHYLRHMHKLGLIMLEDMKGEIAKQVRREYMVHITPKGHASLAQVNGDIPIPTIRHETRGRISAANIANQ